MTKAELIKELEPIDDDTVIVCADEHGGWDNIKEVGIIKGGTPAIIFGGGSPFSSER